VYDAINKVEISLEGVRILRINYGKKIGTPGNGGDLETDARAE
jgi:hypothetical protein